MHIKLNTDGSINTFPYSLSDLRKENPHTSFPSVMDDTLLADYNVFSVTQADKPEHDKRTKKIQLNSMPTKNEHGFWQLEYSIINKTEQEILNFDLEKEIDTRIARDNKLRSCDWIVTRSLETNTNIPEAWSNYRQALRDITTHENFPYLNDEDWPAKP